MIRDNYEVCGSCFGEGERHYYDGELEKSEGRCPVCDGSGEVPVNGEEVTQ